MSSDRPKSNEPSSTRKRKAEEVSPESPEGKVDGAANDDLNSSSHEVEGGKSEDDQTSTQMKEAKGPADKMDEDSAQPESSKQGSEETSEIDEQGDQKKEGEHSNRDAITTSTAMSEEKESAVKTTNGENEKGTEDKGDQVDNSGVSESSKSQNPYDSLRWIIVKNDGRPESLIKLVALKSLFSKQLPKMPRTYIARLVFDRRHISLVILSDDPALKDTDEEVIGSICYRPFPEMRFAEIAFCAVNASHQVKGYGTKLMNLVKKEGARTGIEYFITYADNYAIGYFKKQGFSKSVSMPKGRYQGLIKDYDGGTMMECYVHPSIDFTRIPEMLAAQRKFILSRIRLKAKSHKIYEPLPKGFSPNLEGVSRANEAAARAMAIPGIAEAGWTMTDLLAATGQGKDVDRAKNALKSEMLNIVRKVEEQQFAWPFREPVDTTEVKDYLDVIKEPIDLSTIDKRIRKGDHYRSKKMLYADLMLIVNNCKLYNEEESTYVQCAVSLEKYLGTLFAT